MIESADPTTGSDEQVRQALRRRASSKRRVQDRLTLFVVRSLFFLTAAGLGLYGVQVIGAVAGRSDLDPITGILVGCGTAIVLITLEIFFARSPIRTLSAVTFGLIMGLILTLVFSFVVEFILEAVTPADVRLRTEFRALHSFLQMLTLTIFCYFGVTILLQTRDDFKFIIPYVEFRRELRAQIPLILDTSCFVDGRVFGLLSAGVFDQRLVVPTFVLNELQLVADSADKSLRERGRRGLDILHEIERTRSVEILDVRLRDGQTVDLALLEVAQELDGKLLTTDYNLQKNARLQGVPVVNVNDVAVAVKPAFVPGERLSVRLLRAGDGPGQAVGFLPDGTMVVVEEARHRLDHVVDVVVTSSLQTNAGKMVFGRLHRSGKGESSPGGNPGGREPLPRRRGSKGRGQRHRRQDASDPDSDSRDAGGS